MIQFDRVEAQLADCRFGHTAYTYASCPSTQDIAHSLALTHRAGTLVVAEGQTAGRGRHGRSWRDRKGCSLAVSFLLKDDLPHTAAPSLALLTGMAVLSALEGICPERGVELALKWPNDVVHRDPQGRWRKLAGILLETRHAVQGTGHAVVGIGINVNHTWNQLPPVARHALPPSSLALLAGQRFDRTPLLIRLCRALQRFLYLEYAKCLETKIWETRLITLEGDAEAGSQSGSDCA